MPFAEIAATGDLEQERTRFIEVLSGKKHDGCIDFTCLNADATLFVSGMAVSLPAGVEMSREAIESGAAMAKLRGWVQAQNRQPDKGLEILEASRVN